MFNTQNNTFGFSSARVIIIFSSEYRLLQMGPRHIGVGFFWNRHLLLKDQVTIMARIHLVCQLCSFLIKDCLLTITQSTYVWTTVLCNYYHTVKITTVIIFYILH